MLTRQNERTIVWAAFNKVTIRAFHAVVDHTAFNSFLNIRKTVKRSAGLLKRLLFSVFCIARSDSILVVIFSANNLVELQRYFCERSTSELNATETIVSHEVWFGAVNEEHRRHAASEIIFERTER